MRDHKSKLVCVALCAVAAGCASDHIAGPASAIDTEVRGLLADVTIFTDDANSWNETAGAATTLNQKIGAGFDTQTAQLQTQWALAGNAKASHSLTALDVNAASTSATSAPTNAAASPASASVPAAASSPVMALAQSVAILDQLSKPGNAKSDFDSGFTFLKDANAASKNKPATAASAAVAASNPAAAAK